MPGADVGQIEYDPGDLADALRCLADWVDANPGHKVLCFWPGQSESRGLLSFCALPPAEDRGAAPERTPPRLLAYADG